MKEDISRCKSIGIPTEVSSLSVVTPDTAAHELTLPPVHSVAAHAPNMGQALRQHGEGASE